MDDTCVFCTRHCRPRKRAFCTHGCDLCAASPCTALGRGPAVRSGLGPPGPGHRAAGAAFPARRVWRRRGLGSCRSGSALRCAWTSPAAGRSGTSSFCCDPPTISHRAAVCVWNVPPNVFRLRPTAAEERGVWTATRGPRQRGPCRLALMDAWRASRGLPVGPSLSFMTEVAELGRKPASPPRVAGCATSGSKPALRARRVCHLRWEHRRSLSWRVEGTGAGLGASHGGRGSGCLRPVWPRLKV